METTPRERQSGATRRRVLDAVFRLVAEGGVSEASLRKVADASGVNIGSVRHYFGSHEALMTAAAEEAGARMERRLAPVLGGGPPPATAEERRAHVEAVARALLPLRPEERAELIVLVEFVTAARLRPEFRPLARRMGADMREVFRRALRTARVPRADLEAERLVALVEGLTYELVYPHGATGAPGPADVLRHHLAALIPTDTPS